MPKESRHELSYNMYWNEDDAEPNKVYITLFVSDKPFDISFTIDAVFCGGRERRLSEGDLPALYETTNHFVNCLLKEGLAQVENGELTL